MRRQVGAYIFSRTFQQRDNSPQVADLDVRFRWRVDKHRTAGRLNTRDRERITRDGPLR
jgi:hypothetical protein